MTSYVPRTGGQKKKNILHQKELELKAGVRRNESSTKIQRKVEKVRLAHLGVIKALLQEITPYKEEDEEKAQNSRRKLMEEREFWANIPTEEIIKIYSKPNDDTPQIDRKNFWDFREK